MTESKDAPQLEDYLQWDIYAWQKALKLWGKILKSRSITSGKALEIGSKDGGLSLFLAYNFDMNVICSDLNGTTEKAKLLHKIYNVQTKIKYTEEDATKLSFDSNTFDIIIFKSVLGSIGRDNNISKQKKAVNEMLRVLKSGGILLFAENCKASFLHTAMRKFFSKWASYWRYVNYDEMNEMLSEFSLKEIHTCGFLSAFVPGKFLKRIIAPVDNIFEKLVSKESRYILYGYAIK